jgi:hypothetical protein
MMLTMMSTPNWTAINTFWMRSETTMPRALTNVIAMMKNEPSVTFAQRFSASSSWPRNLNR